MLSDVSVLTASDAVICVSERRPWAAGDVIGVCMDLEKGELSFIKNGVNMGGAPAQHTASGSCVTTCCMSCDRPSCDSLTLELGLAGET